ncbi:hypothetical protein [Bacteroides sp. ET336]|uniref:hypothetical protein n=1 Tax=Bacteroides sp. ET336 TaxID=2972459 RepID=UPI0021AB9EA7|nr:hypothetical protein [Bacteroides sp. ET336]MCR8894362.1 hypothetical protein [Bacteroides sp. ET336]MDN0058858.1 hypothetical protein [Bacteroides caecigallinarum]
MRKWTYLVAALLMSGTAATFTSCIDTTEPAGIEALRGAKADFIKAKAEYERALVEIQKVKIDREKVQLELDNIVLETEKLKLELAQAQNEKDKLDIQLQIELMQKQYEEQMIYADKNIATAQEALLKALNSLELAQLTDRDNKFQSEILTLRNAVSTALQDLSNEQNTLSQLKLNQLNYLANHKYYVAGLELTKTKYEKDLEILESLLANYNEIENADIEALTKQKADIESQIIALREKEEQEWSKYLQMREGEDFTAANKAVQDIIVKLEAESSFTLPLDKVNAAIQEDLYTALNNGHYDFNELNKVFNEDYDALIADIVLNKDFLNSGYLQYQDLADEMETLANTIIDKGQDNYVDDYNDLFPGANLSKNDIFDENNEVVPSISAKIEAEKNRLASDQAKYKADYDAALNAWIDSYIAFNAALKAYGGYETTKPMDDMINTINGYNEEYNKSIASGGTAITLATAKQWRSTIVGFYQKRNVVDGALESEYATFYDSHVKKPADGSDPLTDATLATQLPILISDALNDFNSANNYDRKLNLSASYSYNYEGESTYQKLVNANVDFFGDSYGSYTLANIIEPILKEDGTKPEKAEDAIPADIKAEDLVNNSAYSLYWSSVNFDLVYPAFTNYANWKATYDFIAEAQVKEKEAIEKLVADKDAKVAEYNDLFITLWEVELKGFLINGTQNGSSHQTGWFSATNPYKNFATGGNIENGTAIPYDNQTEFAKLDAQLDLIEAAIENGELSYVVYDPDNGFTTTNGLAALSNIISYTETTINDVKSWIDYYDFLITQYNENGFDPSYSYTDYDQEIEDQTKVVEYQQQNLDMLTAQLTKVLNAYEGTAE